MTTFAGIDESFALKEQVGIYLQSIPYDGTSTWCKGADKGFSAFMDAAENNELVVRQYAEENGFHPSIIYSFYQYEMEKQGENFYGAFQNQFPDTSAISKRLNINIWSEESIQSSVEKVKTTLSLTSY